MSRFTPADIAKLSPDQRAAIRRQCEMPEATTGASAPIWGGKAPRRDSAPSLQADRATIQPRAVCGANSAIRFTVPGVPVGKQRARVCRGGTHSYTPKKTVDYERSVLTAFRMVYPTHAPYLGPVALRLMVYLPIPKSMHNARRIQAESERLHHIVKPDWSNVLKSVEDALNGHAWHDDSQVCVLSGEKRYSRIPRVEVEITPIVEEGFA